MEEQRTNCLKSLLDNAKITIEISMLVNYTIPSKWELKKQNKKKDTGTSKNLNINF